MLYALIYTTPIIFSYHHSLNNTGHSSGVVSFFYSTSDQRNRNKYLLFNKIIKDNTAQHSGTFCLL